MKRNMDLVRRILLEAEKSPQGGCTGNPQVDGYSELEVQFHVHLLNQAGLINAAEFQSLVHGPTAEITSITWAGYDFIDTFRSDTVWNAAKAKLIDVGVPLTIEYLVLYGKELAKEYLSKIGISL